MILPVLSLFAAGQVCAQQNALDFDGFDDYVNLDVIAPSMAGSNDQMIQMWVRCDKNEQSGIRTAFFSIHNSAGSNKLIFNVGGQTSQTGQFVIYDPGGLKYISNTIIGDNQCHHILYVNSNNTVRVWIDGVHDPGIWGFPVYSSLNLVASDRYSLGQEYDGAVTSDFYDGIIDEFSIWNVPHVPTISGLPGSINNPYTGTEPGLSGYYKFDQGIAFGNNTLINFLNDSSTPQFNGDLLNFALVANVFGTDPSNWVDGCFIDPDSCIYRNELQFDGIDDYANINSVQNDLSGSNDFTVEFLMRGITANQGSVRTSLFAVNSSDGSVNRFMLSLGGFSTQTGNLVVTDVNQWGTQNDFISQTVIGDGKCHHIAYVRSGNTGIIYIDGNQVGTHNISYSFAASDVYSIGQEYDAPNATPSQFYNGAIDEFRIWNIVRSPAEIQQSMSQTLTGNEPGLIAYYDFNQGTPAGDNTGLTFLPDVSPNFNSGALTNFSLTGFASNYMAERCLTCVYEPQEQPSRGAAQPTEGNDLLPSDDQIEIYPNPTNSVVNIQLKSDPSENLIVKILDISGKIMIQKSFNAATTLDVSDFKKGMYIIVVENNTEIKTEKLIIQ